MSGVSVDGSDLIKQCVQIRFSARFGLSVYVVQRWFSLVGERVIVVEVWFSLDGQTYGSVLVQVCVQVYSMWFSCGYIVAQIVVVLCGAALVQLWFR